LIPDLLRSLRATQIHQTVSLSGILGTTGPNQSASDEKAAPVAAWLAQTSGMVSTQGFEAAQDDAARQATSPGGGKVPHSSAPVVQVNARAGLGVVSGQDTVFVSDENVQLTSGLDTDVAAGGAMRVHTGQAIGILGGAIKPGDQAAGTGVTMIAGAGDIDVQAQAATLQVAALKDVLIQSQSAGIDWAAAKRIVIATAGGASITIEGGNVTFACPGTITVHAGRKSLVGPAKVIHPMPTFPQQVCQSCLLSAASMASPFAAKT
jgi:uncharacterized protein (DUF2345 family)